MAGSQPPGVSTERLALATRLTAHAHEIIENRNSHAIRSCDRQLNSAPHNPHERSNPMTKSVKSILVFSCTSLIAISAALGQFTFDENGNGMGPGGPLPSGFGPGPGGPATVFYVLPFAVAP